MDAKTTRFPHFEAFPEYDLGLSFNLEDTTVSSIYGLLDVQQSQSLPEHLQSLDFGCVWKQIVIQLCASWSAGVDFMP